MGHLLAEQWKTNRLVVTDTVRSDLDALERISDALSYMNEWAGPPQEDPPEQPVLDSFEGGNLPPDGDIALAKMQTIRTQDNRIIGYLEGYHGFDQADVFWIAGFYLTPDEHRQGYGREAIGQLVAEVHRLNRFSAIRLSVDIKNWPAIRFWTQNGFDRVRACHGDETYAADAFANLILEKAIGDGQREG